MNAPRPDSPYRVVPVGDGALAVEFEERIDPAINARAVSLSEALSAAGMAGIRDIVPVYRTVTVYFDPFAIDVEALLALVDREVVPAALQATPDREPLRIPVCYGGEFGPDLGDVAAFGRLGEDEVVRVHTAGTYRVFMLGFLPGFAYLGMLDERIAARRRATPRVRVPGGSVAIADRQTGVYPLDSPGGWQVIGRTPVRVFDPASPTPFLMRPGDAVQFYPVERAEYERLRADQGGHD